MKRLLKPVGLVAIFIGMFAMMYGAVRWDSFANPWLKEVPYNGWSWLTTRHAMTLSYINGTIGWIVMALILSGVFSVMIVFYSKK